MKKVISVSGGMSSAYLAANYPSDELVFALVRTNDKKCEFKDRGLAKEVSDRLGVEFIGTLEDDKIIYTMIDLEAYLGKKIHWVTGDTFEDVINKKGGYLPNIATRFCTEKMKIEPIFKWWMQNFDLELVEMGIGYRYGEESRVNSMNDKLINGIHYFKHSFEKNKRGQNKWVNVPWRSVSFPMYFDFIEKKDVINFWKDKPVRFAKLNNCVGCFHRSAQLLNQQSKVNEIKYNWFIDQEKATGNFFKNGLSYEKIKKMNFTLNAFEEIEQEGCNSGFCGF